MAEIEFNAGNLIKYMKTRLSIILLSLVLVAFKAVAIPLNANIVVNGDFEVHPPGSFPPWQFTHGYIAFINEPAAVASGNNCVFIGGLSGGDLWQDLNTVVGQTYEFSFYERGDYSGQIDRLSLLNVWWGGQEVGSYTNDNRGGGWNYRVFDVVASSTTTRIDFQQASASIGAFGYPGIDAVSVSTVPDVSFTLFLMMISMAGICVFLSVMKQSDLPPAKKSPELTPIAAFGQSRMPIARLVIGWGGSAFVVRQRYEHLQRTFTLEDQH